jgi:hypothetical protein
VGPFHVRVDTDTGAPCCLGDGYSAIHCPCSNSSATVLGAGFLNYTGSAGGRMATGLADVSSDTVQLNGSGVPPNSRCPFFQGSAKHVGGFGSHCEGGLRCATGTVIRLGTKTNNGNGSSSHPTGADPDVSVPGSHTSTGGTRYDQIWYRNAATYCTSATYNESNGYELYWRP